MRYLAARNVTDGSEVTIMQTRHHPGTTLGRLSGRVGTVAPAPRRPAGNSVMASPLHGKGTAVTLSSVGVWLSIVGQAHREQAGVAVRHAVAACAQAAGAGAALSMVSDRGAPEPVFATDTRSDGLEELQATLGQGPCVEALTGNAPVLAEDLADAGTLARWPDLAPAALERGVAAIFAVPVSSGAVRVGVLSLYRDHALRLSADEPEVWLLYADAVLMLALDACGGLAPGAVELVGRGFTERRAEIHQAAGMISVQLRVSVTDALVALRARAYAEARPISKVAADVVARRLSFVPLELT
jgi:hypothetical protein